jgi:endonuclease I
VHNRSVCNRAHCGRVVAVSALVAGVCTSAQARQFDPPADYYTTATGTGPTLRSQLRTIIGRDYWQPGSTTHRVRSYGDATVALPLLARDPSNASNVILIYTGISVPSVWDQGATWNREHTWPDSRGLGGSGRDYTDLHQLRPCNPSVNSSRGNDPFGLGGGSFWDPQPSTNPSIGPGQFIPGTNDRGEMARAMMYMDVRYDGTDASTTDLQLVAGFPGANQMGDLTALMLWHYEDEVNQNERQRNHLVFSNAANPSYFQGNRNPFVDRPEFVWAIFGSAPNDSTLSVAAPAADGSSSAAVSFRVIQNTAPAPVQVTLSKTGVYPTTYNATFAGSGFNVTGAIGSGRAFVGGSQSRVFTIAPTSVATPGTVTGIITIDNTDLTSAGQGDGAQDANDTITISSTALTPSNPSLDPAVDMNAALFTTTLDEDTGVFELDVPVWNFGFSSTAALLDIDTVVGGLAGFSASGAPASNIGGIPTTITLAFDTAAVAPGVYTAAYTVNTSDENIPGATASQVTISWQVTLAAAPVFCEGDANGDLVVNFSDVTAVLGSFGGSGPLGDSNNSGSVDFSDVTTVLSNFGRSCE